MALVEIDPGDYPFHRLIDRRVFENNVRGFAAQLEREPLLRSRDGLGESFSN